MNLSKYEKSPVIPDEIVLWDRQTVKEVIGWKADSALYNAIKRYGFPEPVRIGTRKSMWRKQRVLDWMANLQEGMNEDNEVREEIKQ